MLEKQNDLRIALCRHVTNKFISEWNSCSEI